MEISRIGENKHTKYNHVAPIDLDTIPEEEIVKKIENKFNLTPRGIINYLDLKKPVYKKTTNYGHFGKEDLNWEKIIEL